MLSTSSIYSQPASDVEVCRARIQRLQSEIDGLRVENEKLSRKAASCASTDELKDTQESLNLLSSRMKDLSDELTKAKTSASACGRTLNRVTSQTNVYTHDFLFPGLYYLRTGKYSTAGSFAIFGSIFYGFLRTDNHKFKAYHAQFVDEIRPFYLISAASAATINNQERLAFLLYDYRRREMLFRDEKARHRRARVVFGSLVGVVYAINTIAILHDHFGFLAFLDASVDTRERNTLPQVAVSYQMTF